MGFLTDNFVLCVWSSMHRHLRTSDRNAYDTSRTHLHVLARASLLCDLTTLLFFAENTAFCFRQRLIPKRNIGACGLARAKSNRVVIRFSEGSPNNVKIRQPVVSFSCFVFKGAGSVNAWCSLRGGCASPQSGIYGCSERCLWP